MNFKHTSFLLPMLFLTIASFAQDASVEKSVYGIQAGVVGLWFNAEFRLAREFALRAEPGAELLTVNLTDDISRDRESVFAPTLSIEPRWYYNLGKRVKKGRNIKGNSGNAFSVRLKYTPDRYFAASDDRIRLVSQLAILPSWGIRRVYGKHFTFEAGIGIGPEIYFGRNPKNILNNQDIYTDLRLSIGYTF